MIATMAVRILSFFIVSNYLDHRFDGLAPDGIHDTFNSIQLFIQSFNHHTSFLTNLLDYSESKYLLRNMTSINPGLLRSEGSRTDEN